MKKIMILGASILQLPAIKKAKELGLEVVAVDMNPDAIGFKEDGICKEIISTIDIKAVLEAAQKHKIDGIMTLASDMPMRTIARVAKEMNLIGITEETALKATDKSEMRTALYENNVPIPLFYKVANKKEFLDAVEDLRKRNLKVIVKPADNSGSRGINLIEDYSKDLLEKAYLYSKAYSRSGYVLVEEFMEGPEISVETLTIDGKCNVIQITDKLTTGAPYFVEMGHSQPSELDESIKKEIEKVAIAANKAIGIKNGPSHTEIKVTKDGPKIVELGARLGGDNITTHLVPLSTGVNMVECCIKIALGEKVDIIPKYSKGAAIRYFNCKEGIIKNILGVDDAKKIEGIKQISFVYKKGDKIQKIKNSVDRLGFVIAQGTSSEEAITKCDEVLKKISLEME